MLFHWNDWFQFYLAGFSSPSTALEVYWLILLSLCFFLSFPLSDLSCFLCIPLSLRRLLYSTELVLPPNSIEVCEEVQVNPSRLQQVFLEHLSSQEPIVTEEQHTLLWTGPVGLGRWGFCFPWNLSLLCGTPAVPCVSQTASCDFWPPPPQPGLGRITKLWSCPVFSPGQN